MRPRIGGKPRHDDELDELERTSRSDVTGTLATPSGPMLPSQEERVARLVVLVGPEHGRRYSLARTSTLIGRSDECDVQLEDTKVSRLHARIVRRAGAWLIEDLGSRNGTLVGGARIAGEQRLRVGDRIQLSPDTLLAFTLQDPLEDRLLHRQQMEVIGQLAADIAHDFNNLLNVIAAGVAHLSMIDPSTPLSDPEVRECHEDVRAAAKRAGELTARLLTIARRRDGTTQPVRQRVDVVSLCRDVLTLVRRTFDRSISIESDIEPGLAVFGDQAALHQLLMNLCINARDAMSNGGTLRVSAELCRVPLEAEPHVLLTVRDDGSGMDEQTLARVFEPFFTTKANGAGSGLGLATVFEVATSHHGTVEVDSALGRGSTFRVRLPAVRASETAPRPNKPRKSPSAQDLSIPPEGVARILVVDDQELVRRSLGRLMRAAGHEALFAGDGQQAVDLYLKTMPRPDVVLLDLDMPVLSGAEALERIKEIDPGARVLLVSGYYDEARKRHLLSRGALDFIAKPVDAKKLVAAVRLALALPR